MDVYVCRCEGGIWDEERVCCVVLSDTVEIERSALTAAVAGDSVCGALLGVWSGLVSSRLVQVIDCSGPGWVGFQGKKLSEVMEKGQSECVV